MESRGGGLAGRHQYDRDHTGDSENDAGPRWILTRAGELKACVANAITVLRHAPEWAGVLAYDEFRCRVVMRPKIGTAPLIDWTSDHDVRAAAWFQHAGIGVPPRVAAQAVEVIARAHPFHPVRDYLGGCIWDGTPRLDRWASRYLGAEDTPYVRAVTIRWLISAVARIFEPGCKADCVLILEGRQGLGKSTALRILGGEWFADEIAVLGTKDAAMQVAGVWIIELAELDSLTRAAADRVKAFVSRATDRFRPPYGSRVIEQPRQSVFAGSVNHSAYLRDETGARRFWPIACTAIDLDALGRDRDQIWAETRQRYLSGEPWWLDTPELHAQAAEAQSLRYAGDPWQQAIEDYIAGKDSVSVSEILTSVLAIPIGGWTQVHENRVARCQRTVGWVRRQRRTGLPPPRDREWRYFPPA